MDIVVKRIYEAPSPDDGLRILVDRLWPRGVSKASAELDDWAKDLAPSAELRKSWHADPAQHAPEHFAAFAASYLEELDREPAASAVAALITHAGESPRVTLLTATKDPEQNHALVLRSALLERLS